MTQALRVDFVPPNKEREQTHPETDSNQAWRLVKPGNARIIVTNQET